MNSILDQMDEGAPASGPAAEVTRNWSDLQTAIFDEIQKQSQDLLIQAVAGSGKTTTIIKGMEYAPGRSRFLAFNKAIAEDIRRRAPLGEVKTLNALGHSVVMSHYPEMRLEPKKMVNIIKAIMGDGADFKDFGYTLSRVCGLAKNCAFGIQREPETQEFIDLIEAYAFDVPFDKLSSFATICREGFEQSRLDEKTFDFDDQLWIPIYRDLGFEPVDNVFVDECQDLSPIQHLMLGEMSKKSRIVAVGDRHQAIYGFRGASHQSMDLLKEMFRMKEMPLSISYRCSQSVVLAAQEFCEEIQWREGAPEGLIEWKDHDPRKAAEYVRYMIVCRTNAPLFREILRCVREKEPCRVLSSFLDSFQSFIRGFKATYTSDLVAKLDRWFEREKEAAMAKGKKGKLIGLIDKYETVKLLCGEFKLTADMVAMVKSLGESTRGPIFATIHKSKGLEHEHVYILRPDLLGGFGDLTPEQAQQEENLHYVAITRAAETLTYGARMR